MFNNEATGCFDRIIVSLAMIAAMRLGLPWSVCHMHASILKHMKYFIKTAHGISDAYCRVIWDHLLYGMGQGSGASPQVWLLIVVWFTCCSHSPCSSCKCHFLILGVTLLRNAMLILLLMTLHLDAMILIGNSDAIFWTDCKGPRVCTSLRVHSLQFWWCFGIAEVFLVSYLLAMDWWPFTDGSKPELSGDNCPHWWPCSKLYSDPPTQGLGSQVHAWCFGSTRW